MGLPALCHQVLCFMYLLYIVMNFFIYMYNILHEKDMQNNVFHIMPTLYIINEKMCYVFVAKVNSFV
jgi:hypothetical protein